MFHIQFETPGPPIPIASRQMDALIKRRALLRDRAKLQPRHQQNRRGRQQPEVFFEKRLQVVIVQGSARAAVLPENLLRETSANSRVAGRGRKVTRTVRTSRAGVPPLERSSRKDP